MAGKRKTKAEKLRDALENSVSGDDIKAVLQAMVRAAKAGDVEAAKLVCDRVLGKPSVAQKPAAQNAVNVQVNVGDRQQRVQNLIKRITEQRQSQQALEQAEVIIDDEDSQG